MPPAIELELDSRQRLPLAKVVRGDVNRYRVEVREEGEIILTPVVSLTTRELAVLRRPDIMAAIKGGIAEAESGLATTYPAGYFTKLLADEGVDPFAPDED